MLHSREKRVGEEIRKALTTSLLYEVQDPRVPAILTITQVIVAKDLSNARVWFSQVPDDAESVAETMAFFTASATYLRTLVARQVQLRHTPALEFIHDNSPSEFAKIDRKLKEIQKAEDDRSK